MTEKTYPTNDFSEQKIPSAQQSCFDGFSANGVVGSLLADDLIDMLARMVIEIERSTGTTCS